MKTVARVHDVRPGRVRLACESVTANCTACSGGRGCALRWLAQPGAPILEIPETTPDGRRLVPGDGVVLEVDDGELLRAALLAYLPPVAGLIAGPAVATWLGHGSESVALGAAVAGLALGWGASRAWLGRSPPRYRIEPAEPV